MQRKPWPILFLALFQFLSPLADIGIGAYSQGVSPFYYLSTLLRTNAWYDLVQFFCVAPLGGLAIFKVKRWSYPVFMGCIAWVALSNYDAWQHNSQAMSLTSLLAGYGFNLALVTYFLLKQVRITYYDARVRWWESKPRYTLNAPAKLKVMDQLLTCHLINLSEGGAFIQTSTELKPGTSILLNYNCLGMDFGFSGEVLYQVQRQKNCYGIQFIIPLKKRPIIKKLTQAFELIGIERRPERTPWTISLKTWLKELFIEGKGLVPDFPMVVPPASQTINSPVSYSETQLDEQSTDAPPSVTPHKRRTSSNRTKTPPRKPRTPKVA